MSLALYRKYRPQTFADVVDQDHVKTTLQNEVKNNQIAHAYVFAGPRGVGKTTMARLFAKAVNEPKFAPNSLDIIEIDAASHTGVDHVREQIIQQAYVAPSQLAYKVFIIDEAHMLSVSAFNALLKILEEPPAQVIFILATTEAHKLPATVISRCQRFDFHAISIPAIIKRLQKLAEAEGVIVEPAVFERIARRAGGAIRDAESMLGQVLAVGEKTITAAEADVVLPRSDIEVVLNLLDCLRAKDATKYITVLHQAITDGVHMRELHQHIVEVLRQCLLYSVDTSLEHFTALDVQATTHERLIECMKTVTTLDCLRLLDIFTGQQSSSTAQHYLP